MKNNTHVLKIIRSSLFQFVFVLYLILVGFTGFENGDKVSAEEMINPHDFSNKQLCSQCHKEKPPALKYDEITVCLRCHPDNLKDHIVNVEVKKAILPDGWYLSRDKKLVCYSCHDYHNQGTIPKMLLVEYDKLCILCHVGY